MHARVVNRSRPLRQAESPQSRCDSQGQAPRSHLEYRKVSVTPDDPIHEAPVNPSDLRQMAIERLLDAQVLLNGNRWEFAYYASGSAIGCGLKSFILSRMILTGWVFEEK